MMTVLILVWVLVLVIVLALVLVTPRLNTPTNSEERGAGQLGLPGSTQIDQKIGA